MSATDDVAALLVDASDATPHGKCNAVYVGFEPTAEQAAALSAYSAQFKVSIVLQDRCSCRTAAVEAHTLVCTAERRFLCAAILLRLLFFLEAGVAWYGCTPPDMTARARDLWLLLLLF